MRILIAEDDSTSRLLLEVTLKQWDHDVVTATNGSEAWDILQGEDPPNLAIFDWMMPILDGVEVARRARTFDTLSHLYIIMLTTRDTKDDIAEALGAGADDYITKPFNRKELQTRINFGLCVHDLRMTLARSVREWKEPIQREGNYKACCSPVPL